MLFLNLNEMQIFKGHRFQQALICGNRYLGKNRGGQNLLPVSLNELLVIVNCRLTCCRYHFILKRNVKCLNKGQFAIERMHERESKSVTKSDY